MYKLCKTEKSASRQQMLESGLLAAMISKPYEEISVSDLCDRLSIPRKAFYRYFSGKEGALLSLIDHTLMTFHAFHPASAPTTGRTPHAELTRFFLFWQSHRQLLDALIRSNLTGLLVQRAVAISATGEVLPLRMLPQEDPRLMHHTMNFAVCGMMYLVLDWHLNNYLCPAEQMADTALRLVSQPLFSNLPDIL